MKLLKPCLVCGDLSESTRCDQHAIRPKAVVKISARRRGFGTAWDKLSRSARRLQPWCSDCGSTVDLTVDHSPEAWERHEAGLPIRLVDVDVCCRSCNSRRGAARGGGVDDSRRTHVAKAKFASQIGQAS